MRRIAPLFVALALVLVAHLWVPRPVAACSCAMPGDPMADAAADPTVAVFTGVVDLPNEAATPVRVTRWFSTGAGPAVIGLDNGGFDDPMGGSCGTNRPPAGSEWLFVAWPAERGLYSVSMCTTHADLATPMGRELLASAANVFGEPTIPDEGADPPDTGGPAAFIASMLPVGLLVLFGFGVVAGVVLVLNRREDG